MRIHVQAPEPKQTSLIRTMCPNCNRRRYFTSTFYDWYGPLCVCLKCGERFQGGEQMPRPFCRGWRKTSVDEAKRAYKEETVVKEKPIIFNRQMVQAILGGYKTQTRRIIKPQPEKRDGLWSFKNMLFGKNLSDCMNHHAPYKK